MSVQKITIDELQQRMNRGERITFVDTRSPKAWEESDVMIPASLRSPADEVGDHVEELPHEGPIVTYCT